MAGCCGYALVACAGGYRAYRHAIHQLEERRLLPGRGVVAVGGAVEVGQRRLLPERALGEQVNHESCGGAREA